MKFTGLRNLQKPLLILIAVFLIYDIVRTLTVSHHYKDINKLREELDKLKKKLGPRIGKQGKLNNPNVLATLSERTGDEMYPEEKLLSVYRKQLEAMKTGNLIMIRGTPIGPRGYCKNARKIDAACVDTNCTTDFHPIPEENVRDVLRRQYHIPTKYSQVIAKMVDRKLDRTRISFVTAASSNHFYECQVLMKSLIENVFPQLSDFRFYVYDLGLKPDQVQTLETHCPLCHVRKVPWDHLPPVFSKLKSYTWKPLLVQTHLAVSQYLFWMDASVRFHRKNITGVLERVRERGMLISPNQYSTAVHTDTRMYDYFGVKWCQMSKFRELEGTFLIFHNNIFTQKAIVLPWLSCAFAPNCMYPFDKMPPISKCISHEREFSGCHRYDQSAITTILSMIYTDNVGFVFLRKNTINGINRREKIKYFPEKK